MASATDLVYIPVYLSQLGLIEPLAPQASTLLKWAGDSMLAMALAIGAIIIIVALVKGMAEHKRQRAEPAPVVGYEE